MKIFVKNSCFALLFLAASGLLSGCLAATMGSALFTMLPSSYDYIDKNSPSSTQRVTLSEMEDVAIVTLKELDFALDDVKETVVHEKDNLLTKSIIAHPAKAKKKSLKVEVLMMQITHKVTKIIVTAKDSSLSYDGATAQAILDEILVNVEMEKSYVDLDKFLVKADRKKELKQSLKEEKSDFDAESDGIKTVPQQTPVVEGNTVETSQTVPEKIEKSSRPMLKKKMNSIITSESAEKPFIKRFKGLRAAPYTIKIGTFSNLKNVNRLMNEWKRKGQIPFYSSIPVRERTLHRVFLNRFPSEATAKEFVLTLKEGRLLHGEAAQPYRASYAIKTGECVEQGECEVKVTKLIASGVFPYLHPVRLEGKDKYLILVGGYSVPAEADSAMQSMEDLGLEYSLINP